MYVSYVVTDVWEFPLSSHANTIAPDGERYKVQLTHVAFLFFSCGLSNIADLPPNFSPWWKNKMAARASSCSISMVIALRGRWAMYRSQVDMLRPWFLYLSIWRVTYGQQCFLIDRTMIYYVSDMLALLVLKHVSHIHTSIKASLF